MKPLSLQQVMQQAVAHHEAGRLRDAEILYRQILSRDPNHAEAMNLLGVLAHQLGRNDAAEQFITRALSLKPAEAPFHVNLGVAQAGLGKFDEAMATFQHALELDAQSVFALGNLAHLWMKKGQPKLAVATARKALSIRPDYPEALNILGIALQATGDMTGALGAFEKTRDLLPDAYQAHNNIGNLLKDLGRIDQAIPSYRRAAQCKPLSAAAHSNMLYAMHFSTQVTAPEMREARQQWSEKFAAPLAAQIKPHDNDPDPDRTLRIGYVSPDFREHSAAVFIQSLLAAHDPAAVEVFCYASLPRFDKVSAQLQKLAPHWRDIAMLQDAPAAEMIRADRIDILVDLAGHTAGNRLLLFCRKPAPIQINYLGYPDVTGLPTMDYRLTDIHADPPENPGDGGEELLRLPETFLCFTEPDDAPPPAQAPSLTNGFITFGCFNPLAKLNATLVGWWARILQQVPGSRMMIKTRALDDPGAARGVAELFAAAGIGPERLILQGYVESRRGHLETYGQVDIALDTFPYHGTTTTCEALWMGVPVVTLAGNTHVSRVGASLLGNLALGHLIADSPEDYMNRAVEAARQTSGSRAVLRGIMARSPLMDARKFVRNVESVYREVWRKWRRK